jgi:hypothetical protein
VKVRFRQTANTSLPPQPFTGKVWIECNISVLVYPSLTDGAGTHRQSFASAPPMRRPAYAPSILLALALALAGQVFGPMRLKVNFAAFPATLVGECWARSPRPYPILLVLALLFHTAHSRCDFLCLHSFLLCLLTHGITCQRFRKRLLDK